MTFLVTGANRGLGLEFVVQLLAAGHSVVAWARKVDRATELNELKQKHSARLTIDEVDVSSFSSIQKASQKITALDVLINNAGVLLDAEETLETLTPEVLQKTFQVNVYAPLLITQQLLSCLAQSASPLVVNMSSLMGSISDNSSGGYYAYRMSKTALNMFTKSFSIDHPSIKTLCLHPGWVQTDMGGVNAPTKKEKAVAGLLKVILEPQNYASGSFVNFGGKSIPW